MRVKICGITREQDRDQAVALGVDALGFVFTPRSKRYVETAQAKDLINGVPAFVSRVGLFMDQDVDAVLSVLKQVPLSLLQFHGSESAEYCGQFGLPWIKAVSMTTPHSLAQAEQAYTGAAGLLLDSHVLGGVGGTGQTFDWELVTKTAKPLILAGGLTPANVREAVQKVHPWAVDVSSGVESAPGIKSAEKMREFIEEAKS